MFICDIKIRWFHLYLWVWLWKSRCLTKHQLHHAAREPREPILLMKQTCTPKPTDPFLFFFPPEAYYHKLWQPWWPECFKHTVGPWQHKENKTRLSVTQKARRRQSERTSFRYGVLSGEGRERRECPHDAVHLRSVISSAPVNVGSVFSLTGSRSRGQGSQSKAENLFILNTCVWIQMMSQGLHRLFYLIIAVLAECGWMKTSTDIIFVDMNWANIWGIPSFFLFNIGYN